MFGGGGQLVVEHVVAIRSNSKCSLFETCCGLSFDRAGTIDCYRCNNCGRFDVLDLFGRARCAR
eukprot:3675559-Lingulodinium_polyedra.AAC.1